LYSRTALGGASTPVRHTAAGRVEVDAMVRVADDGTVSYLDSNERPLDAQWIARAKRHLRVCLQVRRDRKGNLKRRPDLRR
jgi:hypothetical protein